MSVKAAPRIASEAMQQAEEASLQGERLAAKAPG
jgi:hypothetical protein